MQFFLPGSVQSRLDSICYPKFIVPIANISTEMFAIGTSEIPMTRIKGVLGIITIDTQKRQITGPDGEIVGNYLTIPDDRSLSVISFL